MLLVILDGASEPLRDGMPTSLERAATPALDALCAEGTLTRLRTVAPGLEAGSEHAIPALLGWTPPAPVDRGAVEAAAREIAVGDDERAWRIDVRAADGARADAIDALPSLSVAVPSHRLHPLGGHRLLAVGREPLPSLPAPAGATLVRWPEGIVPPRLLDRRTVMVAAPGAAAGVARLLGARVVTPAGATGRPDSDLAAKAAAALALLDDGAERIVVHVGGPDEAAHERDAAAKVAAIEAADRDLIAPLAAALRGRGSGTLRICPDHGCDPADGRHHAAPVPCVRWSVHERRPELARRASTAISTARRGAVGGTRRLTERAVAGIPATSPRPRSSMERAAA